MHFLFTKCNNAVDMMWRKPKPCDYITLHYKPVQYITVQYLWASLGLQLLDLSQHRQLIVGGQQLQPLPTS